MIEQLLKNEDKRSLKKLQSHLDAKSQFMTYVLLKLGTCSDSSIIFPSQVSHGQI